MTLRPNTEKDACAAIKLERPAMLHFPFLDMSSRKRSIIRMGIEEHKKSYLEKDPDKWEVQTLEGYNISDVLKEIMGGDHITTASETFMFYED